MSDSNINKKDHYALLRNKLHIIMCFDTNTDINHYVQIFTQMCKYF